MLAVKVVAISLNIFPLLYSTSFKAIPEPSSTLKSNLFKICKGKSLIKMFLFKVIIILNLNIYAGLQKGFIVSLT